MSKVQIVEYDDVNRPAIHATASDSLIHDRHRTHALYIQDESGEGILSLLKISQKVDSIMYC
jgi:hypothetical protein